jgi:hypothetical protein
LGVRQREAGHGRPVDAEEVTGGRVAFAEDIMEPVGARTGDVRGQLPDRPLVRGGPERELLGRQDAEGLDDSSLVLGPSRVERVQR